MPTKTPNVQEARRQHLGAAVTAWREQADLSQTEAGVRAGSNDRTWRELEKGLAKTRRTYYAIEHVIGIERGSIWAFLQQGKALPPFPEMRRPTDDVARLDRIERQLSLLLAQMGDLMDRLQVLEPPGE